MRATAGAVLLHKSSKNWSTCQAWGPNIWRRATRVGAVAHLAKS